MDNDWLKVGNTYKLKTMRINGETPSRINNDDYEVIETNGEIAYCKHIQSGECYVFNVSFLVNPEKPEDIYTDWTMEYKGELI